MMLEKKHLITLLLVVALASSNFGLISIENIKSNSDRTDNEELLEINIEQSCNRMRKDMKLSLKGRVVKLSDLDFQLCNNPKVIEIFAKQKVIIDLDLKLIGKEVQLIIIAPIWEIISYPDVFPRTRLINLNGINGTDFNETRAKNGTMNGNRNGANGFAGKPGGPAGSFYGIADKIINAENLIILANGGRGGNGQGGGHGAKGADGFTYNDKPNIPCSGEVNGWNSTVYEGKYDKIVGKYQPQYDNGIKYTVLGKSGKVGGSGGHGGVGGKSGKKGNVNIFEISNNDKSLFHLSAIDGEQGLDGDGGWVGLGGKNGLNVRTILNCYFNQRLSISIEKLDDDTSSAIYGTEGKSGASLKRQIDAESSHSENSFPSSLNKYKIYIREHLANSNIMDNDMLWSFYNNLNIQENINKMYNTVNLVEDFIGLEKQFLSLNKQINFTSSYEQLQKRIVMYEKNPIKQENTSEYKNILKELNNNVKGRIESIQLLHSNYDVNRDLKKTADLGLKPLIKDLVNFRKTNDILRLLNNYIFSLEEKMADGKNLINKVALNSVWETEDMLDQEMDTLLTEIIDLEDRAIANRDELIESRDKLQGIIRLKVLFGVLKVGCGVLGVMNPLLGTVATSATTVIEAFATGGAKEQVAVLPKAFDSLANASLKYFTDMKVKQEKIIKQQEIFVKNQKESTTIYGADVIDQVWETSRQYRQYDEREMQNPKLTAHAMMIGYAKKETELTTELDKLKEPGTEVDKNVKKGIEIGLNVTKYLKATSAIFTTASETALNIMKDKERVKEINAAITKNQTIIDKLYSLEESIYSEVMPVFSGMKTNLNNFKHGQENMTEFQQQVAKWNMTGIIKDIQRHLNNVTKNFNVNEGLNFAFNELIRDFDLMFDLYESLLKGKEKKRDKIYLTNLHIAHNDHVSNLLITDSQVQNAISELQVVRMSNDVVLKYKEWYYEFKQYAFPYTENDLNKLPNLDILTKESYNELANLIVKNENLIIEKSVSTKVIDHRKTALFRGSNYQDDREKFSFYIWKNKDNNQAIVDILNGKKVTLVADINKNDLDYNAVKFKSIKILFTTHTANMQEELNKLLNNFDVNMTHHGDSKYKYGNDIYEIKNSPTSIFVNYELNYNDRNTFLASDIANKPYMLSPYATWSIQLSPVQKNHKFQYLQNYTKLVDMELIGYAQFLDNSECDSTCKDRMKEYYTLL
ncbi:putative leucine-rich repeat-containing protein DDB_G0290503 [Leptopilina boulardi]|uniref:putative leucine-rich repeat-containing protein DDB_G0290503 n=1 Tax=Leptopilina boulardi TaxID=63433 RepID=UPI0021F50D56|nr:putative leucine-rich repeat-containing protein DDB_G0290503 [Leptopilina boulardi]